jgi:putative IMPACT (imprinted ancient) family translation regulator
MYIRGTEADLFLSSIRKKYYDRNPSLLCVPGLAEKVIRSALMMTERPSSTAGRPIYGQILSNNLSDVLLVVVRYFGGVKLGVPGLIKAYKTAAADAIAHAKIITKISTERFKITFDYPSADKVMKELKKLGIEAQNKKFEQEVFSRS